MAVALILLLGGAAVSLLSQRSGAEPASTAEQWLAVKPDPLVHQIGLVGKIEPQTTVTLTAPFDGNVLANLVEQGQRVEAGQVLLRMDPATLEVQLRDALSAQLKARRTVQEMQDWGSSPTVSRARRSLRAAEMTAGNTQRKLTESENLFKRGIIPATNWTTSSNKPSNSNWTWWRRAVSCNKPWTKARANTGRSPRWS